ncbi:hypothetical protein H696_05114 [Fonticula alba]|uniref:Vesicle-associated membrane protein 7 n=1 Tax=Fonticula alba TaxID=691883 RepID=A0A058Z1P4_FONAL|nr:hypothetical protein H696_05114 [Fonticula alba]KCV68185.1 hypothetical protein H696_05114 [Fonticula alba]|eukprot:XP_009497239.1 hypothetical protein H696_05114 [Fonticula alba]
MSILYSAVARRPGSDMSSPSAVTILVDHSTLSGNLSKIATSVLSNVSNPGKMSYDYDGYMFHTETHERAIYLCISPPTASRSVTYDYLKHLRNSFERNFNVSTIDQALPYAFQSEFGPTMGQLVSDFNNRTGVAAQSDVLARTQEELDAVKGIMHDNIAKVMDRGERIDVLMDQTDRLHQHSFEFKRKSTQLKRAMWWKNVKLMVLLGFIAIVLVYLFVCIICGFPAWHKCIKSGGGGGGGSGSTSASTSASGSSAAAIAIQAVLVDATAALAGAALAAGQAAHRQVAAVLG